MEEKNRKPKIRSTLKWIAWALLVQFILVNVSASLYGYKFTHFYDLSSVSSDPPSNNFFAKTWRLFRGPHFFKSTVTDVPEVTYDSVVLYTKSKTRIEGWYLPADTARGTVIIVHGLGGNKGMMLGYAYQFRNMNYNVMMIDLRGHGNSGGHTTTLGVRESEDLKLAYDYVMGKGEKNIILYGFSLGAVVVMKSIYDYGLTPSHVVLDAPFASLQDHLRGRARILGFPSEPFATLVTFWAGLERGFNGFGHNAGKYAQKIFCPVLLQHCTDDKLVLESEIKLIYAHIASSQKKTVEYENAGHEYFLKNDPLKWENEMGNFLKVP
ncbi:MAG TPA: alpha/beta fold hydrolase [Chitinophagaceae bacterium]|nr:alpha/beta fold hydrolase [Chitinophagaceae bacterium]